MSLNSNSGSSAVGANVSSPNVLGDAFKKLKTESQWGDDAAKLISDTEQSLPHGHITFDSMLYMVSCEEKKVERRSFSRFMRKVKPVIDALTSYYNVVDTISQVDTSPAAVLWGCLKVLINSADRIITMFEKIKDQVDDLPSHVDRITRYARLYQTDDMRELLIQCSVNVLKFCIKVWKQFKRHAAVTLLRSIIPKDALQFGAMVSQLKQDVKRMDSRGLLIGSERAEGGRETLGEVREDQKEEINRRSYLDAREALRLHTPHESSASGSLELHERQTGYQLPGTCEWVLNTSEFREWVTTNTSRPFLWLTGTAGAGKSVMCSAIVRRMQEAMPRVGVAYHFYRSDFQSKRSEVLCSIALQLLESLWQSSRVVPKSAVSFLEASYTTNRVCNVIRDIVTHGAFSATHVFLDGIDENPSDFPTIEGTLQSLVALTNSIPGGLFRIWISSQSETGKHPPFDTALRMNIGRQNHADIESFLKHRLPQLEDSGLDSRTQAGAIKILKERSGECFLLAACLINDLESHCTDHEQVFETITEGLPSDLPDYYHRQLDRIKGDSNRVLASQMFSIITYSVRPVSVKELRDAICMMQCSTSKDNSKRPRLKMVEDILSRFVAIERGRDESSQSCGFSHSTMKQYLRNNSNVLQKGQNDQGTLQIAEVRLADACLRYLCQPLFGKLLKDVNGRWLTCNGEPVDDDRFLLYAAKYWDKHLDSVKPGAEVSARVLHFVLSSNYQTLLQLQHIFAENHFSVFTREDQPPDQKFLRRALPNWFARNPAETQGFDIRKDYRLFMHEWSYFLGCGCCRNPDCPKARFAGEIDRCFFGAMGHDNFLSRMQSRYLSFQLSTGDPGGIKDTRQCHEEYSNGGSLAHMVQFSGRTDTNLEFTCETWSMEQSNQPSLQQRQSIEIGEDSDWLKYFRHEEEGVGGIVSRYNRDKPIAFSEDALCLRIARALFERSDDGVFRALNPGRRARDVLPPYFEEFASRLGILVISSRRDTHDARSEKDNTDGLIEDPLEMFIRGATTKEDSTYSSEASDSEYDPNLSSSSSEDEWDSAFESMSEASTEPSDALEDENILDFYKGYNEASGSESPETESEEDVETESEAGSDSSVLGANPFSRYLRGFHDDESDAEEAYVDLQEEGEGEADLMRHIIASRRSHGFPQKQAQGDLRASIMVFKTSGSRLENIFRLRQPLHLPLYDSPPALHPSLPLAVWPLGPSTLLFLDWDRQSFFTRKLRPSESHSRQIFIKCHFSPSGAHLHLAALEGRRKPPTRAAQRKQRKQAAAGQDNGRPTSELDLSLFISTYRLDSAKPTRRPPTQIHRAKLNLGAVFSLPVARLPFGLTWTPTHLYVTQSETVLVVHRVPLFRTRGEGGSSGGGDATAPGRTADDEGVGITVNYEPVFLPATAEARAVRFFPGGDGGARSRVLIGSELLMPVRPRVRVVGEWGDDACGEGGDEEPKFEGVQMLQGRASLPVGVFLGEEDLGRWVDSAQARPVVEDRGVGRLDDKVERFDVDTDCDLEPYIV